MIRKSIKFRKGETADINMITHSWLKSYRNGNIPDGIPHTVYYQWYHKLIQELLKRSKVVIAYAPDNPDQIIGYLICEYIEGLFVIHYVYVKQIYRKLGIASSLVEAFFGDVEDPIVVITHMTGPSRKILEHKKLKKAWVYNPLWLFASLKEGWAGLKPFQAGERK